MNQPICWTSTCRHCRFYNVEGRQGGNCQQLGVRVEANWSSCPLALPAFTPSWEEIPTVVGTTSSCKTDIAQSPEKLRF
jgi:hypothetical protein